jgi:hypothetical protein
MPNRDRDPRRGRPAPSQRHPPAISGARATRRRRGRGGNAANGPRAGALPAGGGVLADRRTQVAGGRSRLISCRHSDSSAVRCPTQWQVRARADCQPEPRRRRHCQRMAPVTRYTCQCQARPQTSPSDLKPGNLSRQPVPPAKWPAHGRRQQSVLRSVEERERRDGTAAAVSAWVPPHEHGSFRIDCRTGQSSHGRPQYHTAAPPAARTTRWSPHKSQE